MSKSDHFFLWHDRDYDRGSSVRREMARQTPPHSSLPLFSFLFTDPTETESALLIEPHDRTSCMMKRLTLSTLATIHVSTSLTLLRDLPTPSFIIDTQALRRQVGPPITDVEPSDVFAPSIRCPKNDLLLRPSMTCDGKEKEDLIVDCEFKFVEGQPAIGYLHSSVIRGRAEAIPGEDDPLSTFLAEIDLDPTLCCGDAQLVLGLNNHHVGGYYWARSAGAGSSMDAIGVCFVNGNSDNQGLLRWISEDGPIACNSNDGKRSEWVNFLREGDNVQLLPADGQASLLQFSKQFGKQSAGDSGTSIRIFGISSQGRPMGSEPEVVCEWMISE